MVDHRSGNRPLHAAGHSAARAALGRRAPLLVASASFLAASQRRAADAIGPDADCLSHVIASYLYVNSRLSHAAVEPSARGWRHLGYGSGAGRLTDPEPQRPTATLGSRSKSVFRVILQIGRGSAVKMAAAPAVRVECFRERQAPASAASRRSSLGQYMES